MSNRDGFEIDEEAVARAIKRRMSGLDPYLPSPPPYETVDPKARLAGAAGSGPRVSSRLRPNFGASVALVGIGLVVALVMASGAFRTTPTVGPSRSVPPAPSRTLAPSSVSSEVAQVTPTPSLATASLPPGVIFSGPVQNVEWSPGGTRIAITEGASGSSIDVKILTVGGRTIDTISAWSLGWLDDDSYVAVGESGAFVGYVGSSEREAIPGDYVVFIPASTAGAVALELNVTGSNQYVIWSAAAGLSAPRDGVPVAFSPDGTLLAVVHYPRDCCAGLPSPEPTNPPGPTTLDIVRTDSGKSVHTTGDVVMAYGLPVSFSPDSRLVAFRRDPANGPEDLGILDIATGKVWAVESGGLDIVPQHSLAWLDNTHLDLRSAGPAGAPPAGLSVVVTYWPSDVDAMSASSGGDVATARTGSNQVAIQGGGRQVTRDLPGPFDSVQLLWSPNGATLLAVCMSNSYYVPGQVVLLKP